MTHELGHNFSALNDHYDSSLNCVSVMGDGLNGCPRNVTGHDNQDVHDVFAQNSQLVHYDWIKWVSAGTYRVAWERFIPPAQQNVDRMHGECKFNITRAINTVSGPYDPFSSAFRNTQQQDGKDCAGTVINQTYVSPPDGQERCFRVRTETHAFASPRDERWGIFTSSSCIARTPDGKDVFSRTWEKPGGFVEVAVSNDGQTTINNLKFKYPGGGTVCTPPQTTLSPGQVTSCSWPSQNNMGYILVQYNGAQQDTIGFDSYDFH